MVRLADNFSERFRLEPGFVICHHWNYKNPGTGKAVYHFILNPTIQLKPACG